MSLPSQLLRAPYCCLICACWCCNHVYDNELHHPACSNTDSGHAWVRLLHVLLTPQHTTHSCRCREVPPKSNKKSHTAHTAATMSCATAMSRLDFALAHCCCHICACWDRSSLCSDADNIMGCRMCIQIEQLDLKATQPTLCRTVNHALGPYNATAWFAACPLLLSNLCLLRQKLFVAATVLPSLLRCR